MSEGANSARAEKRKPGQFNEEYIFSKAKRDYELGEASIKINPKKTALIVVDMIEEFTKPKMTPSWIPEATKQLEKIKDLIETCRKVGVQVIYTCYAFHPKYVDMNPAFRDGVTPLDKFDVYEGPALFQKQSIDPHIKPDYEGDVVIAKSSYGAFTGTTLDYILKNRNVDTVIICGTMTNYCCGTTAREAHGHGYKVVFGSDVNSTDDPALHEAELKTLRRGFALVITGLQIREALLGKGPYSSIS